MTISKVQTSGRGSPGGFPDQGHQRLAHTYSVAGLVTPHGPQRTDIGREGEERKAVACADALRPTNPSNVLRYRVVGYGLGSASIVLETPQVGRDETREQIVSHSHHVYACSQRSGHPGATWAVGDVGSCSLSFFYDFSNATTSCSLLATQGVADLQFAWLPDIYLWRLPCF